MFVKRFLLHLVFAVVLLLLAGCRSWRIDLGFERTPIDEPVEVVE